MDPRPKCKRKIQVYLDNAEAYLHIGVSEGFSFRESGKVFVLFTKRVRLIHTVLCLFASLPFSSLECGHDTWI